MGDKFTKFKNIQNFIYKQTDVCYNGCVEIDVFDLLLKMPFLLQSIDEL